LARCTTGPRARNTGARLLTDEEKQWLQSATVVVGVPVDNHAEAVRIIRDRHQAMNIFATRDQLVMLLGWDQLTEERRKEITAAMQQPAWTNDWPEWREKMAPQQSSEPGTDFLEELK
jgi:hypothetical protein